MPEQYAQNCRSFRIIDLMLVTVTTALVFSAAESTYFQFDPDDHWILNLRSFAYLVATSICLASLIWIPLQRAQSGRFFLQPGHWILAALTCSMGMLQMIQIWNVYEFGQTFKIEWERWNAILMLFGAVCYLLALGILLVAMRYCKQRRWKVVMAFMASACLLPAILNGFFGVYTLMGYGMSRTFSWMNPYHWVTQIITMGTGVTFCVAAAIDLANKIKRDWLHWIGLLVAFIFLVILPLVHNLYILVFRAT